MPGRKPDFDIVAKPKDGGPTRRIGALWKNQFGGYNAKFNVEESEYTMPAADVVGSSDYFFNVWPTGDKGSGQKQASEPDDEDDDF
jgi:hypothetical protein